MQDEATRNVAASTLELRNTVDAAKALIERGRAMTPRGGTPGRRTGPHAAADPTEARTLSPSKDITPRQTVPSTRRRIPDGGGGGGSAMSPLSTDGSKRAMLLERNAALEEANRLRRALDDIGDIEHTMHEAVQQAVLREKQRHRDEVAVLRREAERAASKSKAESEKLHKEIDAKDDRIQSLSMQVASVKSGDAASAKIDKLHDEISFLTSELVARDTMVDEKSALVLRLQDSVDGLERDKEAVTQQLLETQGVLDALQRQVRRSNEEWVSRQDAHLASIASLRGDLERAEVEELTLRRTMEQVQVASNAAIQSLTSTVERHCATIAELEASLSAADVVKLRLKETHQGLLRGTQNAATCALHQRVVARYGQHALRRWQLWAERRRACRAEQQVADALAQTRLEADAMAHRQQLERNCWASMVDGVLEHRSVLLAVLRRYEQMHGRLEVELHRTESKATMQRDDLKKSLEATQQELRKAQDKLTDAQHQNEAQREKLQAAELLAQKTALEHAAQQAAEASHVALLNTRMRDAEANHTQRMRDCEEAIQRERDALERERAMANNAKGLLSERDAENTQLRIQEARLQQDLAHAQSSLEQLRLSSERQAVDWAARCQEWKAEQESLLASLQQQRDAGRDALAHHVARDAEERVLRERLSDADQQRKQAVEDMEAFKLEVHHLKRQLQSTKQSLSQQLETMATLRSSSSSNRQSPAMMRTAMAATSTGASPTPVVEPVLQRDPASSSHTTANPSPTPQTTEVHDGQLAGATVESASTTMQRQPNDANPGIPPLESNDAEPGTPPPPQESLEQRDDPEVQLMTAQLATAAPPTGADDATTHLAVALPGANEDDSDLSEMAVLRASVESLGEQLRFVETECEWWKAQAARTQTDAKQLQAEAAAAAALEAQIESLTTQLQQQQMTNEGLLSEHQRLSEVCKDQQAACAEMRAKVEAAEDIANSLSRELDQTTLLKAELHQRRSLEQQVLAMSTDKIRLEARARELQGQLDEQHIQVGCLQDALDAAEAKVSQLQTVSDQAPPAPETDALTELVAGRDALSAQLEQVVAERDNLVRSNAVLQEELSDIRALSGEMKSAYAALSSPQPHTPQRHTPPPCGRCADLELQLRQAVNDLNVNDDRKPDDAERARRRKLEAALDVAEVDAMQAHSALKRMEASKELMEARLRELAAESGNLRHALSCEEEKSERIKEAFTSLVHRLCRVLRIPTPEQRAFFSSDGDHDAPPSLGEDGFSVKTILMAVDALQAAVTAATDANQQLQQQLQQQQHAEANDDTMPLVASTANKQLALGSMPAVEVEELLQRLVDTHRREVRKLSLTNTQLLKLLKQSIAPPPAAMAMPEGSAGKRRAMQRHGAAQRMAVQNGARLMAQVWLRWRLLREGRRRERIVASAQTTVSRLQEQQLKLKNIASAAMRRVKELETRE